MSSSEGFRVVDFVGAVPRRHRSRPSESLFPIQAHGAPEEQRPSTSSDASSLRRLLAHQHDALLAPVAPPRRSKGGNRYSLEAREQQVGNKAPLWDLVRGPISGGRRLLVELCIHIFEFLAYTDVVRVSRVSRLWHRASNADVLWARIHTSMRLVNDNDHDRLRFGIPAVSDTAASPSTEDPWRNAVGARGGVGNRGDAEAEPVVIIVVDETHRCVDPRPEHIRIRRAVPKARDARHAHHVGVG
jgi:hypothetical protein